jgi:hypothetical protein
MIKKTRWRPDTCGCEVEYEWDDSLAQENRVHQASGIIRKCSAHQNTSSKEDHFDKVLKENQMKNVVEGRLLEDESLTDQFTDEQRNLRRRLKPGIKYNWSFDQNRNLIVDLVGGTKTQKEVLKAKTDSLFGNKVAIK